MVKRHLNHGNPDAGPQEDGHPVHEEDGGDGGEHNEPEPQEHIDLFIDYVERKNTEGVVSFNATTWPVLMERALGHLWHNAHHDDEGSDDGDDDAVDVVNVVC